MLPAEVLARLVDASRETAGVLLAEDGVVAPFALTLDGDDGVVRAMFPADDNPDAELADLIELAVRHARTAGGLETVAGVAVVAQLPGGGRAFGTQVATRSEAAMLLHRYSKGDAGWEIEPHEPSTEPFARAPLF